MLLLMAALGQQFPYKTYYDRNRRLCSPLDSSYLTLILHGKGW